MVDWKHILLTKLKVAVFILSLAGWFLLFIFLFVRFFHEALIRLNTVLESNAFIWGLRIFVFSLVILMIKKKQAIEKLMENKKIRRSLYTIQGIGAVGWLWWFATLIF